MTIRILVAVAAGLALTGPGLAQPPAKDPPLPPPAVTPGPAPADPAWTEPLPTGSSGRWWASADAVAAWMQNTPLPALITTSPPGTARTLAGIPEADATTTVYNGRVNGEPRIGFRAAGGYWFDPGHIWGMEVGVMMLESQATGFSISSDGSVILARPFLDANLGTPQAVLVAFPGSSSGSIEVRASSGNFYEGHLDVTEKFLDNGWLRMESILGYRFYRYDDGLRVRQVLNPTDGIAAPGTSIITIDDFGTHNQFHGGEAGLRARVSWEDLSLGLLAKLAVGNLRREVRISGGQEITVPGAAPTFGTGGVYALSSNIGVHHQADWTIMPEFGADLSWQLTSHVRLYVGYSILLLNDVARSADQIDLTVNPNLFPPSAGTATPARPAFQLDRADVWIQTASFGVEFTF